MLTILVFLAALAHMSMSISSIMKLNLDDSYEDVTSVVNPPQACTIDCLSVGHGQGAERPRFLFFKRVS